jgi:DNA polymerase-3 subunit chi
MKAWEQGHKVMVRTAGEDEARQLDELMWDYPPGRFLPHEAGTSGEDVAVAIAAHDESIPDHRDLVINLCSEPVPDPSRYRRLCEIVPAEAEQRTASRIKFKIYREQGLSPATHTIT